MSIVAFLQGWADLNVGRFIAHTTESWVVWGLV